MIYQLLVQRKGSDKREVVVESKIPVWYMPSTVIDNDFKWTSTIKWGFAEKSEDCKYDQGPIILNDGDAIISALDDKR